MSARFDIIRQHSNSTKPTVVRLNGGVSVKLTGMPDAGTRAAYCDLALAQTARVTGTAKDDIGDEESGRIPLDMSGAAAALLIATPADGSSPDAARVALVAKMTDALAKSQTADDSDDNEPASEPAPRRTRKPRPASEPASEPSVNGTAQPVS